MYLNLPYTGDIAFNSVRRTLNAALKRTFNAAQLVMKAQTLNIPLPQLKMPKSLLSTSHCIYQFTCCCGDTYIGRTDRRLEMRAKEHVPKRLQVVLSNPASKLYSFKASSSVTRHLIETRHQVDRLSSFKILTINARPQRLKFLEALLINYHKPVLCAQKDLKVTLKLPWFY